MRPRSGAVPECAEAPRVRTTSVDAALRRTTTPSCASGPRSPASKQRQASKPANRSPCTNGCVRHSSSATVSRTTSAKESRIPASARKTPSASTTPPFMSTAPEPTNRLPLRSSGRCSACGTTVSRWPSNRIRARPEPSRRARKSGACPGLEHSGRSTAASAGSSAPTIAAASSSPGTSPDGDETPTSASSSRSARAAISSPAKAIHSVAVRWLIGGDSRRPDPASVLKPR